MAIQISGNTIIDDSRVVINASKIGIGTPSPQTELHIENGVLGFGVTTDYLGIIALSPNVRIGDSTTGASSGLSTYNYGNIFIGAGAGSSTEIFSNIFLGDYAGFANTTGYSNNFFGLIAGYNNTTGSDNNFFGLQVGYNNTTGSYNNFFGYLVGYNNTTGSDNNFFGNDVGYDNTTGSYNNFFGYRTGENNTTGCDNIFIGYQAGFNNTTASNNIAIGKNSGTTYSPSGLINFTTTGNQIVMGNADHTTACIQIAWGVASDIRYKCVWDSVKHGREFLRGVNPIKYSFKDKETGEVKDSRKRYGFSAQEILELEGDEPIIVNTQDPNNLGITHDYLIPVLVNAVKELDEENKKFKTRLELIEKMMEITSS